MQHAMIQTDDSLDQDLALALVFVRIALIFKVFGTVMRTLFTPSRLKAYSFSYVRWPNSPPLNVGGAMGGCHERIDDLRRVMGGCLH